MLRRVILHRPDLELKRLTPRNKDELLFDDVLWVRRARQEHDAFADALAERGVEVLYLHELLGETLDIPDARDLVLERTTAPGRARPELGPAVRRVASLAVRCRARRAADRRHRLRRASLRERRRWPRRRRRWTASCSPPLPNHLFTRDTSAWVYGGVTVHAMAKPARRREAVHLDAIYKPPPAVRGGAARDLERQLGGPAQLEGGDVLVIGTAAC